MSVPPSPAGGERRGCGARARRGRGPARRRSGAAGPTPGSTSCHVDGTPCSAQPVLDERPGAHVDRAGRHDPEAQQRRRDRLEVAGVGEEGEDLLGRAVEALLAVQDVDAHHLGYGPRVAHDECAWATCARPRSRRCAPTTTCAARPARRSLVALRATSRARAASWPRTRLRGRARPGRLPPLRAAGRHPRAVALAHASRGGRAPGRVLADARRALRRPGPHRRPAPVGARASALGLDVDRFEADRRDPDVAERVARDVRDALRAGATATPTAYAEDARMAATMGAFGLRDARHMGLPTDGRARKEGPQHEQ